MAHAPLDCPFSLYPVNRLKVGAEVNCQICNRKVAITLPPPHGSNLVEVMIGGRTGT